MNAWMLFIHPPGATPDSPDPIAEYTNTNPGGIVGGFRWSLDSDGDCIQMEFDAVPKLVNIPPRANVWLVINNTGVWFGTIVRTGPSGSGRSWRYVALGGRHLLKYAYANYVYNQPTGPLDIALLAANAWNTVQNPPLYRTMAARLTGYTLTRLVAQWVDMYTLLSDLARAAGDVPWGVDRFGNVFFNRTPTTTRVSADRVSIEPLPVEADDVWSAVILYHPQSGYAFRYEEDGNYGERLVVVPDITSYMDVVPGTYGRSVTQLYEVFGSTKTPTASINQQLLLDWDPATGYSGYIRSTTASGLFGFHFTPSAGALPANGQVLIYLNVTGQDYGGTPGLFRPVLIAEHGTTRTTISPVMGRGFFVYRYSGPPPNRLWVGLESSGYLPDYHLDVYDFIVFQPGDRIQRFARSFLQLPHLAPRDIRIAGYVAPTKYLYIDGLGIIEVDTWEYEYTTERGLLTTARVGQRGSEHQQAQRLAITGLSREWAERLRLSIGRTA